ncbi:hypothetical protein IE077_002472 [Cardiosporidium cionae]|uniref:Small ribosomal subunit protein mS29 n=1 Tax=Cardiosporidium cionae TaxID=476202 RepID=A0ABQ7JG18_9APIC|nr:hypothetical protein IE077_002472 [Cardiosporidium cionae]|eukprot:KAF8822824.1 hypothetical protein IE077_002472 [Cardiosporidium cionae]
MSFPIFAFHRCLNKGVENSCGKHVKMPTSIPLGLPEFTSCIKRWVTSSTSQYNLSERADSTHLANSERRFRARITKISNEEQHLLHPMSAVLETDEKWKDSTLKMRWRAKTNLWEGKIPRDFMPDLGRFHLFSLSDLKKSLPEGLAGELEAEIAMLPSHSIPLGLMYRKSTLEIIAELMYYKEETEKETGDHVISSRGILLDGHRGTGKSSALNCIVPWAREQGWMVLFEPRASRFGSEVSEVRRSTTGIYIQSEQSRKFLERAAAYNASFFERIPVCHKVFGKCSLDGTHQMFSRRAFDALVKKAVDNQLREKYEIVDDFGNYLNDDVKHINILREKLQLWHKFRHDIKFHSLSERLKPKNLWDIVDFGLQNEAFSSQCLYELFEQLKKQTMYPLLIVVDEWNECFPVSKYLSINYENTKYDGWIPSYHLSMPRLFFKWDGDEYKRALYSITKEKTVQYVRSITSVWNVVKSMNKKSYAGMKLYATSWKKSRRRSYRPDLLGIRFDEIRTIRNFSMEEFANVVANYRHAGVIHNFPQEKLEYFYMLSEKRPYQLEKNILSLKISHMASEAA